MSQSAITSRAQVGMAAPAVTVETHLSGGLPGFTLVGLPATAVRESRDRVRSALINCGFAFPKGRVVVNLAPGDLTKEGPRYDLAIAASILCATGQIPRSKAQQFEYLGELSLDGALRSVRGALCASLALLQQSAAEPARTMILPAGNAREAALLGKGPLLQLEHLSQLRALLANPEAFAARYSSPAHPTTVADKAASPPCLEQILGQESAKRALLIAAAGGHHLLMVGPPGTGKTMLARALAELLPPLTRTERIEVAAVYSAAGATLREPVPPFREPHHSSSATALIGGGASPRPGEISMAHCGVLFLDELPHFNSNVLELLREPLSNHSVTIARARYRVQFPARFQLLAAMNPCPAGMHCEAERCRCTAGQVRGYQARISGPLLDRIDLQVAVPAVPQALLLAQTRATAGLEQAIATPSSSNLSALQAQVRDARERQLVRQGVLNSAVGYPSAYAPGQGPITEQGQALLGTIAKARPLSARAYHRLLKVARTIADLAAVSAIDAEHISEAFGLRQLDWEAGLGMAALR